MVYGVGVHGKNVYGVWFRVEGVWLMVERTEL